jgi:uncharacterized protein YkwD
MTPRENFLDDLNEKRNAHGCQSVEMASDFLTARAHAHSVDMADAGYIFHSILHIGDWSLVGEIIGEGHTESRLFQEFMDSPDHREIMMDCRYDKVALGFYRDNNDILWITGRFYAR